MIFLILCWLFLAAAILLNLASYLTSFEDVTKEIAKIDSDISTGRYLSQDGNFFRAMTVWLNRLTLVCFGAGTLMLFWFTYTNVTNHLKDVLNVN